MIPQDILNWVENTDSPNKDDVVELITRFNSLIHPDPYYRMSDDPYIFTEGRRLFEDIVRQKQQIISQIKALINE